MGKEIYAKHCVKCHGQNGRGEMAGMPDFSWKGADRNGLSRSDPQLVGRIKVGKGICPAFHGILTDPEIMNVVTYLRTFR
ncbi:MAG: cytochrome c [Magnetococcales bacterium]|nr:cytochrome c [Magnetococcales bacterium]NGZ28522.1 cytochrome c [Magnetococcales bacterium]